ncbi:hypothetical protein [uncultured Kordia sp.]|uniref:hypothetical protein n=1 Tax=uncultured Kordia sp. TaxID=507699 RepID=UPI00261FC502|nr:hypothetical protein [uncultured Kordia sp.]
MKKKKLKRLQLNKKQISNFFGGKLSAPGTTLTNCLTAGEITCHYECVSEHMTCHSEYGTACGTIKTYEPRECVNYVKTVNPATITC